MKISDIHSAKRAKIKLSFVSKQVASYDVNDLIHISRTNKDKEFYVEPFGKTRYLCSTDIHTARYVDDLLQSEEQNIIKCLFIIEGVNSDSIEIQAYSFRSLTEYKTDIVIKVSQKVLERNTVEKLKEMFVWDGLGKPTIFLLSYKDTVKNKANIRLLSDKCFLYAQNTVRGLIASKVDVDYARDRANLPVDVYIAPSIKFVEESGDGSINNEFSRCLERISSDAPYFTRWEAYNELSKKQIENEASDFGEVVYTNIEQIQDVSGTYFEFSVNEQISSEYIGYELAVIIEGQKVRVGQFKEMKPNNILVTYKSNTDLLSPVPIKGRLVLSTAGDYMVIKRRERAKQRMLSHLSPIKYIVRLIEEGVSEYSLDSNWGDSKAITNELKKNFKKATSMNQMQQKALDIAINTPDIALIQGPPGTGKTTVIQAICERFREIFENDIGQRPKILISSFQNEAVENAISKQSPGDIPAQRIGRKNEEQNQKIMEMWFSEVKNSLKNEAVDNAGLIFAEQKRALTDEFFVYKNSGETIGAAVKIIKKYLSFTEVTYPKELVSTAQAIANRYQKRKRIINDEPDPIVKKLKAQRLTREAFSDDGADNARRLVAHLRNRDDLKITQEDISAISAVYDDKPDNAIFNRYVETVKKLLTIFCAPEEMVDLSNELAIKRCILELDNTYSNSYLSLNVDLETKKSLVIGEFLDRLENEYDSIVAKYSLTTAATCQTSLQLSKNRLDYDTYDLVIVDEAARANPLDLFIPMSMGRKIILVGDHKQLPHMLEPDVLKLILDDPKYKDLPGIDISLFQRLYEMFSKGIRPKSIFLDTQYRMHPDICEFVSEQFYDGTLKSGITAEDRIIPPELFNGKALSYINVSKNRGQEVGGISKSRPAEVSEVTYDIKRILEIAQGSTIGVITFYSAQKAELIKGITSAINEEWLSNVEINTVDAFQGKEFDYVLLSCVRSNGIKDNKQKSIGFLVKKSRICVAFSRAKKHLSVYGDAETLNQIDHFEALYIKCKDKGEGYYREY
ncbi:MAG: AAA family ATPase [Deferribacteraceae bacterium]|nr:AAA family ATPase [Deferribacteraceae bacterium]